MEIETAAHFIGPNIFSAQPLMRYRISGLKKTRDAEIGTWGRDVLLRVFPELASEGGTCEASEFFESVGPDPRCPIAHAVEHVALALQNRAGSELICARTNGSSSVSRRSVLLHYEETEVCDNAVRTAGEIVERIVSDDSVPEPAIARECGRLVESFLAKATRRMLPIQDRTFVRAARDRDVPTRRIAGRMVQLGQGRHQKRVSATKTTLTNVVSNDLAANKDFSRRILGGLGLPIPRYERVYRNKDAVEAAERIGFPVVVKPNQGNMGHAVSVGMDSPRAVRAAYKRAKEIDRSVLIEELIEGDDYRLLVINGEFRAASKRTPGHVVGDGVCSIEELVAKLNADPRRGTGPRSPWTRLEFDEQADRLLAGRKMDRASIPPEGETVFLRRNANTSDGGTAMDVTDEVHPDNRMIAVRAARAIGLDIAGVDFLTKDIGRSMWRTGGVICEINSRPGLRKHMWPANGPARDIMTPIVDMLFPLDQPSRIPVFGILGIDKLAARRVARTLAHLLAATGKHVGLAVGHHVSFDGRKSRSGRMKAPAAAQMILLDPEVDVAVLELTVNDVVRDGLGCDAFDVSLIVPSLEALEAKGAEAVSSTPSPKANDAIRVVTAATRGVVLIEGAERFRAALEAGKSEIVEIDLADAMNPSGETEEADDTSAEERRALGLASEFAIRLGMKKKDIRRALRNFDPQTGRRKARVRSASDA